MANNVIKTTKTKNWWAYLVLGIVLIILGVIFLPIWGKGNGKIWDDCPWADWGAAFVCLCIGIIVFIYLFTYLIKQVKRGGAGAVKVLAIIEFILLTLIGVTCIFAFSQAVFGWSLGGLNLPTEGGKILGIALYTRGVVEIFRCYYHKSSARYPLWWLCVAVVFVTVGCWFFFRPPFSNATLQWMFSLFLIVLGIFFTALSFVVKPIKK